MQGEIMRNAMRLVSARGDHALDYATTMADTMREKGDEGGHAFWTKIARQVELLLRQDTPYDEDGPDD